MKTMFYKIEKNDKLAYLLGSFHLQSQHPKVSIEVLNAFEQVQQVMLETNLDEYSEVMKRFKHRCETWMLKNQRGQQLRAKDIAILASRLGSHPFLYFASFIMPNIYQDFIKSFVPLQAANIANGFMLRDMGFNKPGLDWLFMLRAKESGKELKYLETLDEHLDIMVGLSLTFKEQSEVIHHMCQGSYSGKTKAKLIASNRLLEDAFLADDLDFISKPVSTDSPAVLKYLHTKNSKRDQKMALNIHANLRKSLKSTFIVVGAAHVAGIIKHLQSLGCNITPIEQTEKKYYIDSFYNRHHFAIKMRGAVLSLGLLFIAHGISSTSKSNTTFHAGLLLACVAFIANCQFMYNHVHELSFFDKKTLQPKIDSEHPIRALSY